MTTILEGVGIIGIALGFAAKDTLSNIIAGFFLFWDKPFVIGDLIEVSDEYGEVREITLRSTRIVTVDGKLISIPNSVMVNTKVRSYTMSPHLRLDIDVTIGVNEKIAEAREVILGLVRGDARFLTEPPAEVVVAKLGDYCKDRARGALEFESYRTARRNPALDPLSVCKLLLRDEALTLLDELGEAERVQYKPRAIVYAQLAQVADLGIVQERVRRQLKSRTNWRVDK